jgi:hypothetical protein
MLAMHSSLKNKIPEQCFIYTPGLRGGGGNEGRRGEGTEGGPGGIISAGMIGGNSEVLRGKFPLTGLDKTLPEQISGSL